MKTVVPFRMGDVVVLKKDPQQRQQIVHEAQIDGGTFIYCITHSAWHQHRTLRLVREADRRSLNQLRIEVDAE